MSYLAMSLEDEVSAGSRSRILFWVKFAAQILFAILIIFDSLYLVLCYATFGFFGFLSNPIFGWIAKFGSLAAKLYFPALVGALLSLDIGRQKQRSRRFAVILAVAYLSGALLLLLPRNTRLIAWTLLYGPNVQNPFVNFDTYIDAIVCLLPLFCLSLLHILTVFRAAANKTIQTRLGLGPCLMAGTTAFGLYAAVAVAQHNFGSDSTPVAAFGLSLGLHLVLFTVVFLVVQWINLISNKLRDPGTAKFWMTALAVWILVALIIRKIVFTAFPFNSRSADYYAAALSFVLLVFTAAMRLKIKEFRTLQKTEHDGLLRFKLRAIGALAAAGCFYYFFAIRFAPIDFGQVIGSLTALGIWALLLWFYFCIRRQSRTYRPIFLALLSLACLAGAITFRSLRHTNTGVRLAEVSEQYAGFDASFSLIERFLEPAVRDEEYAESYEFLRRHAEIRTSVPAPEVRLVQNLAGNKSGRPNIFLFVIDALRQDYLAPHNPAVNFTPEIQAFAGESIVFRNAYSPYGGTALAEPAIWSGFQQLHKVYPEPFSRMNNLQRILDANGYHCYVAFDHILDALTPRTRNITALNSGRTNWLHEEFGEVISELEEAILHRSDADRPIFAYAQPANMHTLSLGLYGKELAAMEHPGFDARYASAVAVVDKRFGDFIKFLKTQHLYENSIVILTADHGDSLGEMGRRGHVEYITPEVMRIPFIIHLPQQQQSKMVWDTERWASLHDITPTLYYLLGYRPLTQNEMVGSPLFTLTAAEQRQPRDHYFLMSSYWPVFGILSNDLKNLFIVDAIRQRNYYYNLQDDPYALKNRVTAPLRDHFERLIRQDLEKIDRFYGISEQELE